MTLYDLINLTKVFGTRRVVDIDRLKLREGQIYALLGPNGAGKTTLLNMLALLDAPSSGQLFYNGQPVHFSESHLQPLRRQVVIVDQTPILFSTTVAQNIDFGLKIRGIDRAARARRIDEALDLVGMRAFATAEAQKLSGGETQRVAFARALALSPRVLLCDEPTANVDHENRAVIVDLLGQINAEKKITVIFATHDRSQATILADQTLVLEAGRLVEFEHDNRFTASLIRSAVGPPSLSVGPDLHLPVPAIQTPSELPSTLKISIDPAAIQVRRLGPDSDRTGPDIFEIIEVTRANGGIRMVVSAGMPLTVILNCEEYRALKPMVGERVALEIPPTAVKMVQPTGVILADNQEKWKD